MKRIVFLLSALFFSLSIIAQVPKSFQYQAVVRDLNGNALTNHPVTFKLSIISGILPGTVVYVETHAITTNDFGIATLAVGNGTPVTNLFSDIDWSLSPSFLKVEANLGTGLIDMGTTQLLSVPYALYAQTAGGTLDTLWLQNGDNIYNNNIGNVGVGISNPTGRMVVQGSSTAPDNLPLFEVKNKTGQSIFVVYPDSVHVYVKDDGSKSNKGGFAVSGRSNTKAITNNYLNVTPDQTRIYTSDPVSGFGVGDVGSGTAVNYMHLNPENYFIGHNAGENLVSGFNNLFLGYQCGKNVHSGSSNICIGYQTGFNGYNFLSENIFLGNYAGYRTNSSSNIFIGKEAGYNNVKGDDNIYIGNQAGYTSLGYDSVPSLSYHAMNTIIGSNAGKSLATLQGNTIIGASACKNSTNSFGSTIIGSNACLDGNLTYSTVLGIYAGANATGTENIYIGGSCGRLNVGSNNVFIGNSIYSYASDHLNNKFILKSSTNIHPILFGDFLSNQLVVNGDSSDNTTALNFFVNGSAGGLFAWSNVSDKKFKKNIETIANPLDKVKQLRGVNFEWNDPKKFESGIQMGFIAQEVEKVIPEVVRIKEGDYAMQYAPVTALLVEAIKEQQKQIENLNVEILKLKKKLNLSE